MLQWIIIGLLIVICIFLIIKLKNKVELDKQTLEENKLLEKANIALEVKREEINNSLDLLQKQAQESATKFYEENLEKVTNNLQVKEKELKEEFNQTKDSYEKEYLTILQDIANLISEKNNEVLEVSNQLLDLKQTAQAAIEAEKRKRADALEEEKYKILISDIDLLEINKLREITPYLRNARPVYKIIWEGYYRNPTNDLVNRVLGTKIRTGIYCLTNTLTNMKYIGQAVNVGDRWKQHIKCGLGIDTPNNQLYQIMKKDGVENFKFELLEECKREDLNRKEKYWINFFKTDDFGYNMTKGNK